MHTAVAFSRHTKAHTGRRMKRQTGVWPHPMMASDASGLRTNWSVNWLLYVLFIVSAVLPRRPSELARSLARWNQSDSSGCDAVCRNVSQLHPTSRENDMPFTHYMLSDLSTLFVRRFLLPSHNYIKPRLHQDNMLPAATSCRQHVSWSTPTTCFLCRQQNCRPSVAGYKGIQVDCDINALQWKPQGHRHRGLCNKRTRGKEIWRKKCVSLQQVSGTAGGRWRQQHSTELDGDK